MAYSYEIKTILSWRGKLKIHLIEYFEKTVEQYSNKIAVIENDRKITFAELALQAQKMAQIIIQRNIYKAPIAVFLDKSIENIVSDIGIIYSGNFYMNLDTKTPIERLKNILTCINPAILITSDKLYSYIKPALTHEIVIKVEEINQIKEIDVRKMKNICDRIIDTDPLCVINTSGSTGTPKGVVLNHRSYIDYVQWGIDRFSLTEKEILGVMSPTIFDHYNFEISLMMSAGVTLVLLNNNLAAFPQKLLDDVVKHEVSFIFLVPALMVNIANMNLLEHNDLSKIRFVWFAGEVFPTKQFNIWRKYLPQARFVNLYGPIETTVDCTYYEVLRDLKDEEPIPIGYPCKNTDILILDEKNNVITTQNVDGELCVRGTSLAMGYYNNPERTNQAFVQNPLNNSYPEFIYKTGDMVCYNNYNEIVFRGRKDSLIKHLGYRIELGEIEHIVVNVLKIVKNCCVVYQYIKKEITIFYEAETEISIADFRKQIGNNLPKYMVPTIYIFKKELPRNTNGKIDRLKLSQEANV